MKLCCVACPRESWSEESIQDAYRVGSPDATGYRIVIVKFSSESIKHNLFRGWDALRANGIRNSEELTTRQRTELNNLKAQGKSGFYINGKFHIRFDNDNSDKTRQFVNAKRKMQHMELSDEIHNTSRSMSTATFSGERRYNNSIQTD